MPPPREIFIKYGLKEVQSGHNYFNHYIEVKRKKLWFVSYYLWLNSVVLAFCSMTKHLMYTLILTILRGGGQIELRGANAHPPPERNPE